MIRSESYSIASSSLFKSSRSQQGYFLGKSNREAKSMQDLGLKDFSILANTKIVPDDIHLKSLAYASNQTHLNGSFWI